MTLSPEPHGAFQVYPLHSNSVGVRYKAAGALVTVPASHAPTAIKAAAYIKLIAKESDNNVKLLVLRESRSLAKIMQEMVMNNLRVLSSRDLEVRRTYRFLGVDYVNQQ